MKLLELQIPVTLNDVLKKWSHQAGPTDKVITTDTKERVYMNALMSLFSMFAKYHAECDDGDFVRIFRFFRDSGLTKRLSEEAGISSRFVKLEHQEPGVPELEPKPKIIEINKTSVDTLSSTGLSVPLAKLFYDGTDNPPVLDVGYNSSIDSTRSFIPVTPQI